MDSSDVLVLGGGFAGLSCATALAQAGIKVTVLEKKPHLGGRAFSFVDPRTGETVDNGQHLFMGCYRQTRAFLRRIGTEALLHFPSKVRVDYADAAGGRDALRCPTWLPAPFHLALGVLGLRGLSWNDKSALPRLDRAMRRFQNGGSLAELDRITVRKWLNVLNQPARLQERVFDPIALGALNDLPDQASALGFVQVLREIFYKDTESARLGLSSVGLSELYTEQAKKYIEDRGGKVLLSKKIVELVGSDGNIREARAESGERFEGQAVVSSLPPWSLRGVQRPRELEGGWTSWEATPIIGINLWLDQPVIEAPLIGLLGTDIHWAFNKTLLWKNASHLYLRPARVGKHLEPLAPSGRGQGEGQYLSLVISGAHRHVNKSPQELFELAQNDMGRCFPAFQKAKIMNWSVVKEPFATPSPVCGSDAWRPKHQSPIKNFYFAGDWTQTGLPATIESAVASGHACTELILGAKSLPRELSALSQK